MIMIPPGILQVGGEPSLPVYTHWDGVIAAWEFDGDNANSSVGGYLRDELENYPLTNVGTPVKLSGVLDDARGGPLGTSANGMRSADNMSIFATEQSFSFCGWVSPLSGGGNGYGHFFHIYLNDNDRVYLGKMPDGTGMYLEYVKTGETKLGQWLSGGLSPDTGTFYHVAFTYAASSRNMHVYFQGAFVGTMALPTIPSFISSSTKLQFTQENSTAGSGGYVDAWRMFDRVLTASEISTHYNGGAGLAYLENPYHPLAPWTPKNLDPDVWIDPSDLDTVTKDGSERVSQINDKSGNAHHVTASGDARPTYLPAEGLLSCDGVDDLMQTGVIWSEPAGTLNSYTVMVAARPNKTGTPTAAESNSGAAFWTEKALMNPLFVIRGDTGEALGPIAPILSATTDCLVQTETRNGLAPFLIKKTHSVGNNMALFGMGRGVSGATTSFINGDHGIHTEGPVEDISWEEFHFPGSYTSDAYYNGAIGEIVIVRRMLTPREVELLEGYMAHKWGTEDDLPAGHPFKAAAPLIGSVVDVPASEDIIVHIDAARKTSYPGSGTTWTDMSGHGNDFTLYGSPNFNAALVYGTFEFSGASNQYANLAGSKLDLRYSPFTVSYVSRYGSGTKGRVLGSNSGANFVGGFHAGRSPAYYAGGWVHDNDDFDDGIWRHITLTGDQPNDTWQMYQNGVALHTANNQGSLGPNGFRLGGDGAYSEPSDCDVGWFIVYDRVLTAPEIAKLHDYIDGRYGI